MNRHILRIRETDEFVFDSIKKENKTVETRAATDRYRNIKVGDILVFVCQKQRIEKEVVKINHFKSIEDMIKVIDFKKIIPFVSSVKEMKEIYYSFPGYRDKIKEFGLIVFFIK